MSVDDLLYEPIVLEPTIEQLRAEAKRRIEEAVANGTTHTISDETLDFLDWCGD